jgi:hypothetical protein
VGDAPQTDGRKRRAEAMQLQKNMFNKKHGQLNENKVRPRLNQKPRDCNTLLTFSRTTGR